MIIRKSKAEKRNDGFYSKKYVEPVIPEGYVYVEGTKWNSGFQIKRKTDESLFTFIPVGSLKDNGILDIEKDQKFGKRGWYSETNEFGEEKINGTQKPLWKQLQSVRKYGGFYVSSSPISRTEGLKLVSIQGLPALTMVDFDYAMYLASTFENTPYMSSHLLFGAEYDSIYEWFIETGAMTLQEITEENVFDMYGGLCINNIYSIGNVAEWTQERIIKKRTYKPVVRGASFKTDGNKNPLVWRQATDKYLKRPYIGFRVALYIP